MFYIFFGYFELNVEWVFDYIKEREKNKLGENIFIKCNN